MSFGDKLNGGSIKNTGEKIGNKNFGNKIKGTDYGKVVATNAGGFAKKLAGNGRNDDDNVAVNATRGAGRLARKAVSNKNTDKIQKKGIRAKRKDLKIKGRTDDEVLFPMKPSRAYSDKVFDQAKFNFKKRQREAYEERLRKEREAASFWDRVKAYNDDGEAEFKDSKITYGKFSKKLRKSKRKKTPYEEYEEKYIYYGSNENESASKQAELARKRHMDNERLKRIQDKETQKKYARKMNERMMYEKRYKQMENHVKEVKFMGKQSKKRAEKEAKTYTSIIAVLGAAFIIMYTLIAGGIGLMVGIFGGSGAGSSVTSICWASSSTDICNAEEYFYQKWLGLQAEIQALKDADDHDEVSQTGTLEYDHFAFMTYLSAMYNGTFTYDSSLESTMDSIFNDIFSYTYSLDTETRTGNAYDELSGEWVEVEYEVTVLNITINNQSFSDYASSNLSDEQLQYYTDSYSIAGGLQMFGAPTENWMSTIKEYYTVASGELVTSTISGQGVFAMRNGTVTEVGSNYIKVESEDGSSYKISGISSINLSVGDQAVRGVALATSTSEMRVSTWMDGEAINPLFYVKLN